MITQFDETLLQDLDDFIKYYEFTDAEKIYTNGSKLIQVSRIKQWFAYNNKQKELEEKYDKALTELAHESHKRIELEEENESLKTHIKTIKRRRKKQTSKKNKYKDRIDKSIEYIEEHKRLSMFADLRKENTHQYDLECDADDLLKILNGGKYES